MFKRVPEFLWPIFGQPFGHECNILSAKSLNIFSSLLFGSMMTVVYKRSNCLPSVVAVKFPTPAAEFLKSNALLPGEGRVSNAHGMLEGRDVEVSIN